MGRHAEDLRVRGGSADARALALRGRRKVKVAPMDGTLETVADGRGRVSVTDLPTLVPSTPLSRTHGDD